MMNEKIVEGIKGYYDDHTATVYLEVSDLAKKFGITDEKNGTVYVRWNNVNKMMQDIFATSCENTGVSLPLRKGDYIPENDWHIIASVVWTDQGTRITCETWENGLGTREQRVRKEQI